MKKIIIIFICALFTSCTIEIDGPDGNRTGYEEPETPQTQHEWICFMPLTENQQWVYDVSYYQVINADENHTVKFKGIETWTCTRVNWQDSIFTFGSSFEGDRLIVDGGQAETHAISTHSGWFSVQIRNKSLWLLQEGSDTLYPFAGELIAGMQHNLQVIFFSPNQEYYNDFLYYPAGTLQYELFLGKGIVTAEWQQFNSSLTYNLLDSFLKPN